MAPNGLESLARLQEVRVDRAEAKKTARWRDGGMESFCKPLKYLKTATEIFRLTAGDAPVPKAGRGI
jgi:hypothetical protein